MIADGGPSMTARRVAAHRLRLGRVPVRYGDPAADDALAADVAAGVTVPDGKMHDYLGARTAFFDRVVVRAIDRGIRQVVIGGAGYDGRAFRYAAPGVRWFEVDHPATQRDKLARVRQLGLAAGEVRFVAADFTRDPVAEVLRTAGLDPGTPSLFLLEGVAVYLEPAVLETLLGQFRDVAAPGSRLAISMPVIGTQRTGSVFRAAVAAMGEPALSRFEPGEAEDLLARTGWHLVVADEPDDPDAAARQQRVRAAGLLVARPAIRSGKADLRGIAGTGRWCAEAGDQDRGRLPRVKHGVTAHDNRRNRSGVQFAWVWAWGAGATARGGYGARGARKRGGYGAREARGRGRARADGRVLAVTVSDQEALFPRKCAGRHFPTDCVQ